MTMVLHQGACTVLSDGSLKLPGSSVFGGNIAAANELTELVTRLAAWQRFCAGAATEAELDALGAWPDRVVALVRDIDDDANRSFALGDEATVTSLRVYDDSLSLRFGRVVANVRSASGRDGYCWASHSYWVSSWRATRPGQDEVA